MKFNNNILDNSTTSGEEAYYLTEMERFDSTGSAFFNAMLKGDCLKEDYHELKRTYPDLNWHSVTYNELVANLNEQTHSIIVLSPTAKAYKHALEHKYLDARIIQQKE